MLIDIDRYTVSGQIRKRLLEDQGLLSSRAYGDGPGRKEE